MSIACGIQKSKEADEELLGELASLNKRHKCNGNREVPKWLVSGCSAIMGMLNIHQRGGGKGVD